MSSPAAESDATGSLEERYESLMARISTKKAPTVVGIYGIPGSGKTWLLDKLAHKLDETEFKIYEGSEVIGSLVPGGLDGFRSLPDQDKFMWRRIAINTIKEECINSGKVALVAGHFMFWTEGQLAGETVHTPDDLQTYTHIIYLEVVAASIAVRRQYDTSRARPASSAAHLRQWQEAEITQLRDLCFDHNILFFRSPAMAMDDPVATTTHLLSSFRLDTEEQNQLRASDRLDDILSGEKRPEIMLVFDGDKTLAAEDTGELFWSMVDPYHRALDTDQLRSLFSKMGYTYSAFRQAASLYQEVDAELKFDDYCAAVASRVTIHPEMEGFMRVAISQDDVGVLVVTCGLGQIWEEVLQKRGLSDAVKVIGGGRITDGLIVTPDVKAALVSRLRDFYHMCVVAFGDSPLDLPMLAKANRAIVVVGDENKRSKSMDNALRQAIEQDGLRARQLLLPRDAPPRLDDDTLPLIKMSDLKRAIFPLYRKCLPSPNQVYPSSRLLHATDKGAAKLLMTPTRDAGLRGPELQAAHRRIGRYLATEFLPDVIGLEKYDIPHVLGHSVDGYRMRNQHQTLIVALMRGGEPMASGVYSTMPGAAFFHGIKYDDKLEQLLDGRSCVVLVDSVINSGKSIVEFARPIRERYPRIKIVVVAGVVQDQCLSRGGLVDMLTSDRNFYLIALRLSENKFVGKGGTDTGNRLFNTLQSA